MTNKKEKKYKKINLTAQQMFYTNALSIEAIVNVLENKGIVKREEILSEIKRLGQLRKKKMEEVDEDIKKS